MLILKIICPVFDGCIKWYMSLRKKERNLRIKTLLNMLANYMYLKLKGHNEIVNRQISPHVANYCNELRLFTHEVGMLIIVETDDHIVGFPQKMM